MRLSAAGLLLAALLAPDSGLAFRDAAVGSPLPDRTLATADGRRAPLVVRGQVTVFVFLRAGQDHSVSALQHLAVLEREFAGRPVRFLGVIDPADREEVGRAAAAAGARLPLLLDAGDALYGELGVKMHPIAGISGKDGRLTAAQPFRKINFEDALRGQIRLALGEIDEAALARILDPGVQAAPSGGRARARIRLARTLLAAGSLDAAVESARAAVALEPASGEAQGVLAEALARKGDCAASARAAAEAARLAPAAPPPAAACPAR